MDRALLFPLPRSHDRLALAGTTDQVRSEAHLIAGARKAARAEKARVTRCIYDGNRAMSKFLERFQERLLEGPIGPAPPRLCAWWTAQGPFAPQSQSAAREGRQ
jgi:hypothetical protein